MFAGPNGSGKSTLKTVLRRELLGVYLNPDEMEQEMRTRGYLDFSRYEVAPGYAEVKAFFQKSSLLASAGLHGLADRISLVDDRLEIETGAVNSYFASVIADFIRQRLLAARATFTLETVMSHPSKVELLERAQHLGYRTYLYFIATDDPEINISRVRTRVQRGGHEVPEDRIVKRYHASLDLLMPAIRRTNRAFIFDNSSEGREKTWLAEVTEGRELEMKTDQMPAWFKHAVWDKIV
jgi:predicted ABC-type ATPase